MKVFLDVLVYPSGSLLEMSNGYPHSTSPLGGSPSPGPSPGIGGHLHKCKHVLLTRLCFGFNFFFFCFVVETKPLQISEVKQS